MCSEKDMGYLGEDWDCVIFRLNKAFLTDVPQLLGTQQHSEHLTSSSHPLLPQGSDLHLPSAVGDIWKLRSGWCTRWTNTSVGPCSREFTVQDMGRCKKNGGGKMAKKQ